MEETRTQHGTATHLDRLVIDRVHAIKPEADANEDEDGAAAPRRVDVAPLVGVRMRVGELRVVGLGRLEVLRRVGSYRL